MRSFRDRNPVVLGAVCLAAITAAVAGAFATGALHLLEEAYTVRAAFADAAGIRAGDDVRVAGVRVGRVSGIEADHRAGAVVVAMAVRRGVHLGPRTRAEIAVATLLGTKYVRLSGPVARPYLEDQPARRRVIPLERTRTPFDVFTLTTVATRNVEATDTARLNAFVRQLADLTEGNAADVQRLVHGVAEVAGALGRRDAEVGSLLERLDTLSGVLADKDRTLVSLVDRSRAVLDVVARRRAELVAGLRGGEQLATTLGQVLASHQAQLDLLLDTLHPAVEVLDRRAATVDAALAYLGPAALGLALAPTHGPWEDIYVRAVGPDLIEALQDHLGDPDEAEIGRP